MGIAVFWGARNFHLAQIGIKTQGTVVDYRESFKPGRERFYHPLVKFRTEEGKELQFESDIGTGIPSYSLGESVEVIYDPQNPRTAIIHSSIQVWFPLGVGTFGSLFGFIGYISLIGEMRKRRRWKTAKEAGVRVSAHILEVVPTGWRSNGRTFYQIRAQWLNPQTKQIHIFESESLGYDPSPYLQDRTISVFVKLSDPRCYYIEISNLPKLAA